MTQFIAGEPHSPRRRPTCKTRFLSRISLEADARIRTADPFITSEVLYQLSYVGETPTVAVSGASDPRRARR